MSRTIRQTALTGLLGSKRFIVAVCAAIAMVLGAMSVGASIFVPQSAATPEQQAANSPLFTEHTNSSTVNPSRATGGLFTKQHVFSGSILAPKPTPTDKTTPVPVPKLKSSLGIEFGPVDTNKGINLGSLQLKVESSASLPPTSTIESPIVEEPASEPPAPYDEPPKDVSPPQEPISPPTEDTSALSLDVEVISPVTPVDNQP